MPATSRAVLDRRILLGAALGLCALVGYFVVYDYHRLAGHHYGDFPTFYYAAGAVVRHSDPYVPEADGRFYVYPPLLAVLYTPLASLSLHRAAQVMLAVNIACVLLALLVGTREMMRRFDVPFAVPGLLAISLLAALLAENDLRGELQQMETDTFMLLMFTLSLFWLDRRPIWSGAALAFALNIKYLSIILLPYLLLRRRWKAAAAMVGWSIGFALLPALVLGWRENLRCLRVSLGGLLGWVGAPPSGGQVAHVHGIGDDLSVSLTSAAARLLEEHHLSQSLSLVVAALLGVLVLAGAAIIYRRNRLPLWRWPDSAAQSPQPFRGLVALEWVGMIVAALAFSPDTNTRHLCLVLLVYTAAAVILLVPRTGAPRLPLLLGTIVLVVGFAMPIKSLVPEGFTAQYFRLSIVSWALLVMFATLLAVGLQYVRAANGAGMPPARAPADTMEVARR